MAEVETSLDPNAPATAAALAQLRRSLSVRGLDELALATALPTTDDFMLLRFLIACAHICSLLVASAHVL
eukprot:SAG11_NODE_176_length_13359_cov_10.862142_13_plen_70_part_00